MHDSLDPQLEETLGILQEECAEVIQAVSKIFRFGAFNCYHHTDKTNRQRFADELGDLQAIIDLVVDSGLVSKKELNEAKASKLIKLTKWSNLRQTETNGWQTKTVVI